MWHTVGQQLVDSKEKEAVLASAMRWRKEVRVHVYGLDVRHVPAHHVGQSLECQRRCHAKVQCGAVLCVWLWLTLQTAARGAADRALSRVKCVGRGNYSKVSSLTVQSQRVRP